MSLPKPAFAGNPLAIVLGADDLTPAQMQTLAREFNLSETIFVQHPVNPSHTARVRIFLPTAEIPFAGHPTIDCAIHLALAAALGLVEAEIGFAGHGPGLWQGGPRFLCAPVAPLEALARARVAEPMWSSIAGVAGPYPCAEVTQARPIDRFHSFANIPLAEVGRQSA